MSTSPVKSAQPFHVVGIGAGPANLSLAALYGRAGRPGGLALFDSAPGPRWHPGLLFAGARLQTSWVKDLVSLVDPSNPLSFLNYLVTTGRLFSYLNAQFEETPRAQYVAYLKWAAGQLPVRYRAQVESVTYDETEGLFRLHSPDGLLAASRHLILGVGTRAYVPECFRDADSPRVLLAEELTDRQDAISAETSVTVVGGGQTGAECVQELLNRGCTRLSWIGRRPSFAPMDDSPSANDYFRPAYQQHFQQYSSELRRSTASGQALTSDGISMSTLRGIYQHVYEAELKPEHSPLTMYPGRDVVSVKAGDSGLDLKCSLATGANEHHSAEYAVLATGRRPTPMPLHDALAALIETGDDGLPVIAPDYSLRWKSSAENKIYVQNRSRYVHGIADPNLSLLAVRSAIILNSLFEKELYAIRDESPATV